MIENEFCISPRKYAELIEKELVIFPVPLYCYISICEFAQSTDIHDGTELSSQAVNELL